MALFGIFSKEKKESLNRGLEKSKDSFLSKFSRTVIGKSKVDDEVLDDLEEVLISSDVGVQTTVKIIERIEQRVARDKFLNADELNKILREEMEAMGPVRLKDVDDALMHLVNVAKDLSAKGEIVIADTKGDDELVY